MAVFAALIQKGSAIRFIKVAAVELTRFSLGCHAIPLDVAQMRTRCPEITGLELGDPRLDDDAALIAGIETRRSQRSEGGSSSNM